MDRKIDWSGVIVAVIVGGLLFYTDPLGIKEPVMNVVGAIFGPFVTAILTFAIVALVIGLMLYLLKRIIKP